MSTLHVSLETSAPVCLPFKVHEKNSYFESERITTYVQERLDWHTLHPERAMSLVATFFPYFPSMEYDMTDCASARAKQSDASDAVIGWKSTAASSCHLPIAL